MRGKAVIFTSSYLQIKGALYLALHNYKECPKTLVTLGNPDLFKFFKLANEKLFHNSVDLRYIEPFHPNPKRAEASGLKKAAYVLTDILKERHYLKEILGKGLTGIEDGDVFILDRDHLQFSAAKKLKKRNRLSYISPYPAQVAPRQRSPKRIGEFIRLFIYCLTYGNGIALGKLAHMNHVFPFMSGKFIKKMFYRIIEAEERDEIMQDFTLSQLKLFDASRYRLIYFDDDLIRTDYIKDKGTFQRELTAIFNTVSKHFPENSIARKYHPGYISVTKTMLGVGDVLPDFIPAECLYNDNIQIYLGAFTAALSNVEKGGAVSMLDLISLRSTQIRRQLKQILLQTAKSDILFPQSLNEFEEIISGGLHPVIESRFENGINK